jgi:hypothetical protein
VEILLRSCFFLFLILWPSAFAMFSQHLFVIYLTVQIFLELPAGIQPAISRL